jgi:hypothetical protein
MIGDHLSLADLHLAAWIARLVKLAGGNATDDGCTAVGKLEGHVAGGFMLPKDAQVGERMPADKIRRESKLVIFWDAMKERASWRKIYGTGLY